MPTKDKRYIKNEKLFWKRLDKNGPYQESLGSNCWIYQTECNYTKNREAYRYFIGEIQEGMSVLHKCDNGKCVNPDHLFLGTQEDNMKDMAKKGRGKWTGVKGKDHPSSKPKSEEHRKKIGIAHKGRKVSLEAREKLSLRFGGLSTEDKKKLWLEYHISENKRHIKQYLAKKYNISLGCVYRIIKSTEWA